MSLQAINMRLSPELLDKVIVQTLSVTEGVAVGKLVRDVLQGWSKCCGGDEK